MMDERFKSTPKGFDSPVGKADNNELHEAWIKADKEWWENNPMRYDFNNKLNSQEFTVEFYKEIDSRFFSVYQQILPKKNYPFDAIINFSELKKQDCLEIGVGNGTHAQLLASHAKSFTGIDLTEYGIKSTRKRFDLFNVKGDLKQMNAEKLEFEDQSFGFVWSWGVIHHSANTDEIIKQIHRVLKPGGKTTVMVYHRGFCYYLTGIVVGIFKGYFFRGKSLHEAIQNHTDGAIARFYTAKELSRDFKKAGFDVVKTKIYGQKTDFLPIPASKFKSFIVSLIPNFFSRFITNKMATGLFLVLTAKKAL